MPYRGTFPANLRFAIATLVEHDREVLRRAAQLAADVLVAGQLLEDAAALAVDNRSIERLEVAGGGEDAGDDGFEAGAVVEIVAADHLVAAAREAVRELGDGTGHALAEALPLTAQERLTREVLPKNLFEFFLIAPRNFIIVLFKPVEE